MRTKIDTTEHSLRELDEGCGQSRGEAPRLVSTAVIRKCRACGDGFPEEWSQLLANGCKHETDMFLTIGREITGEGQPIQRRSHAAAI
jgi:hypothetical protein